MNYIQNMQLCMQPCILTTVYITINILERIFGGLLDFVGIGRL